MATSLLLSRARAKKGTVREAGGLTFITLSIALTLT